MLGCVGKVWKQGLKNLHLHVDAPPHSLQDGQQDGIGVTHYADGGSYDGFWRQGQKHGVGLYRPSPTAAAQPPGIIRGGRLRLAVSRQLPAPPGAVAVDGDESGSVGWGAAETSFVEPLPLPGMHSSGHFIAVYKGLHLCLVSIKKAPWSSANRPQPVPARQTSSKQCTWGTAHVPGFRPGCSFLSASPATTQDHL